MDAKGLAKFYFEDLKWCGCGNPEEAMFLMGDVLDILKRRSDSNTGSSSFADYKDSPWSKHTDELYDKLGRNEKGEWLSMLALSYLYMLDAHSLTEHGGNVSGCWLTEKGEEVLAAIKAHGEDDWTHEDYLSE